MNKYDLYKYISDIDEDILERSEAAMLQKSSARNLQRLDFTRAFSLRTSGLRTALIVCLCLLFVLSIPAALNILHHKGGPDHNDPPQTIAALEYNGMAYEAVRIPETLRKYGLPGEITPEMAGEHLSYLKSDGGVGYEPTSGVTDIELYQYAPSPSRGVYVLRDKDTWYAVLFCNLMQFDDNTNYPLTELYRIYGVTLPSDIVSISEMGWNRESVIGTPVTDPQAISDFYRLTIALQSYGNADFQRLTFDSIPDEEQPKAHTAFADNMRTLRIETADGLYFFLKFYPGYDWLYSGGTMSYYRMGEEMNEWIARYWG